MSYCVERKDDTIRSMIELFGLEVERYSEPTRKIYRSAINSLQDYFPPDALVSEVFTIDALSEWVVSLLLRDIKPKTVKLYVNNLSALFSSVNREKVLVDDISVFKKLRQKINSIDIESKMAQKQARAILRLSTMPQSMYADIILVSLCNKAMPLRNVIGLKVADVDGLATESRELALRNHRAGYRYVFPLDQGNKTPLQLQREVDRGVIEVLRSLEIPLVGNCLDDTVEALWAHLALMCGANPQGVLYGLGRIPRGLPAFGILNNANSTCTSCGACDYCALTKMLLNDASQWYAMKLRRRAKYEDVAKRNTQIETLFYPCEEIVKRVANKNTSTMRPVLPDIVFFKSRPSNVLSIFNKIGDLAWCYKYFDNGKSRYAIISQKEIEAFQRTIACFTPDYVVAPIGTFMPHPGDKLKIVGGIFSDLEAEFDNAKEEDESTIYQLRICGENGIEWKISADYRLTKKTR